MGSGQFGRIERKKIAVCEFVAKVQFVRVSPEAIEEVVREVAISKLCSALSIGPQVETYIPFDLVVYSNAIQFHLERCQPTHEAPTHIHQLERDLRYNLAVLHSFGIIHKDVKPANTLWSERLQKFLLCDFGISHYVKERIDLQSETYMEGTPCFMSPEMRTIGHNKIGRVNLYYNDVYGLMLTLH